MPHPFEFDLGNVTAAGARGGFRTRRAASETLDIWDRVIEGVLVALFAFAPLALGAVQAWSEMVVLCLATVLIACLCLRFFFDRKFRQQQRFSWCYLPILLFVPFVALQSVSLPAGLLGKVSPETGRLKRELLGDSPEVVNSLAKDTLSFYPNATRHDLAMILAAAAVFLTVSATYRNSRQIRRLLGAVATIGGVVAVLALAQHVTHADKIYWSIPIPPGSRTDAGPFVNHSHFSQFMNLSIGAAIGLLLVTLRTLQRDYGRRLGSELLRGWQFDSRLRTLWLLCGMIVLSLVAVALSMSRGGVLSALLSGAFTVALLTRWRSQRRSLGGDGRGSVLAFLAVAAFAAILYFGYDALYQRFAPQGQFLKGADAGRWQILRDLRPLWAKFPLWGTGLGTHRYVFPMFDKSGLTNLAAHAENEYAQLLEEGGAFGLALALAFIAMIWIAYVRALRGNRSIHAAAFGLGYGLLAVLIHSFSDFGQHIPANACLSAVTCGLLVALTRVGDQGDVPLTKPAADAASTEPRDIGRAGRVRSLGVPGFVVANLLALAAMIPVAQAAWRAESSWTEAQRIEGALVAMNWQGTDDDFSALIADAQAAAELVPSDVEYAYDLNRYRWASIRRDGGPVTAETTEYAARIVEELQGVKRLCPAYGSPYTFASQLELFVLARTEEGVRDGRTGARLSPQYAKASLVLGWIEAISANFDASVTAFRRAIDLDQRLRDDVTGFYLDTVHRADLAVALAGDDANALFRVAEQIERRKVSAELAVATRRRAIEILTKRCESKDAVASDLVMLAGLSQKEGDADAAAGYWRRALAHDLANQDWRLQLAQCLSDAGDKDGAIREAKIVLRSRPSNSGAQRLLDTLQQSQHD